MAKILIVDDSLHELRRMSDLLSKHGHQIVTATGGADGVALCIDQQPDAMLVDVMMPEVNGFQVARQLNNHLSTQHIPIILLSTQDQETDREWGVRQGAKSVLSKPIEERLLLMFLNEWLVDEVPAT